MFFNNDDQYNGFPWKSAKPKLHWACTWQIPFQPYSNDMYGKKCSFKMQMHLPQRGAQAIALHSQCQNLRVFLSTCWSSHILQNASTEMKGICAGQRPVYIFIRDNSAHPAVSRTRKGSPMKGPRSEHQWVRNAEACLWQGQIHRSYNVQHSNGSFNAKFKRPTMPSSSWILHILQCSGLQMKFWQWPKAQVSMMAASPSQP